MPSEVCRIAEHFWRGVNSCGATEILQPLLELRLEVSFHISWLEFVYLKFLLWGASSVWFGCKMKIKNAEHKAMIYKTLCTGHYTGEHLEGLSGAPRCNQLDASVLDQGCIQVVFRLSFCWKMVFVMVICYSAQNRSTYFQSSESLTTLALQRCFVWGCTDQYKTHLCLQDPFEGLVHTHWKVYSMPLVLKWEAHGDYAVWVA